MAESAHLEPGQAEIRRVYPEHRDLWCMVHCRRYDGKMVSEAAYRADYPPPYWPPSVGDVVELPGVRLKRRPRGDGDG